MNIAERNLKENEMVSENILRSILVSGYILDLDLENVDSVHLINVKKNRGRRGYTFRGAS